MDQILDDDNFWEFVNYVEDNPFLPIPRNILRDNSNPFERYSNTELLQRIRFSRDVVEHIIKPIVYPDVRVADNRGLPVSPTIKLYVALRFFATRCYQRICGDMVTISQSCVCRIVKDVSEKLARTLPRFVKFPEEANDFRRLKRDFYEIAGFPGVIGCVDGTHIEIKSPGGPNAELYRNRKGWMSLNVQVVAGPHNQILDIVIHWPGSAHDSRIFNSSSVPMRLEAGNLPGILLGDNAYAQTMHVFTPIQAPATRPEQRYNNAHISTRNVVERTFGMRKGRFRCLLNSLQLELRNSVRVISAVAVLHNIALRERQDFPEENFVNDVDIPNPLHPINARGNVIRAAFIQRHFAR